MTMKTRSKKKLYHKKKIKPFFFFYYYYYFPRIMNIPTELKFISPYIQRAQELANRDPIVSYYAMAKGARTKETKDYLFQLLDTLEAKTIDDEAITNDLVGYAHVENFALKVFLNADNEDRAGKASKKTAKTFLAASIFLELLKVFGELDAEVESKIKYAKWKATDIMKALREGRVPTPGPPNEQTEEQDVLKDNTIPVISEFPSPPSNFTAPLSPPSAQPPVVTIDRTSDADMLPPVSSPVAPVAPVVPAVSQISQISQISQQATVNIAQAQKNAKWAISALDYDDIKTARVQLLAALNEIGFNQQNNFGL
ncbi:Vta1 like-domain-containing protein [Blakeslea trispora]|nr:Vta1 like-domain-containing protein [Blakeslea trispora]